MTETAQGPCNVCPRVSAYTLDLEKGLLVNKGCATVLLGGRHSASNSPDVPIMLLRKATFEEQMPL